MADKQPKIVKRRVESLTLDPKNVRTHTVRNLEAIASSLRQFGQQKPIIVTEAGVIVAGNGTHAAAVMLEWKTLDCVITTLEPGAARAYAIADNRTAELAEWDAADLAKELDSLKGLGFDPNDLGFNDKEILELLPVAEPGLCDADDVPGVPKEPITKPGDVWQLGSDHRLVCGDATRAEDVTAVLGGEKPFLTVTDPPYGVNYDPAWRDRAAEAGHIQFAARRTGEVTNDDRCDWSEVWALVPGDVMYCWSPPGPLLMQFGAALESSGFDLRYMLIWAKPHFPIGRGHYHWRHEPCWYAVRNGAKAHWIGDRKQTTVWNSTLDKNVDGGHSTQKPVDLMLRAIRNHSGDVYDPFLGSGTTLIACEQLNRRCFGIEISPAYCDVIVARWEAFTGKKAAKAKRIKGKCNGKCAS